MLAKSIGGAIVLLGLAYLGVRGMAATEKEMQAASAAARLTSAEDQAFRVCASDMRGKNLSHKTPRGSITLSTVPYEICACQSRAMAKTLGPDRLGEHADVVKVFGENDKLAALTSAMGANADQARSMRLIDLATSLGGCIRDHFAKRDAAAAEVLARVKRP